MLDFLDDTQTLLPLPVLRSLDTQDLPFRSFIAYHFTIRLVCFNNDWLVFLSYWLDLFLLSIALLEL